MPPLSSPARVPFIPSPVPEGGVVLARYPMVRAYSKHGHVPKQGASAEQRADGVAVGNLLGSRHHAYPLFPGLLTVVQEAVGQKNALPTRWYPPIGGFSQAQVQGTLDLPHFQTTQLSPQERALWDARALVGSNMDQQFWDDRLIFQTHAINQFLGSRHGGNHTYGDFLVAKGEELLESFHSWQWTKNEHTRALLANSSQSGFVLRWGTGTPQVDDLFHTLTKDEMCEILSNPGRYGSLGPRNYARKFPVFLGVLRSGNVPQKSNDVTAKARGLLDWYLNRHAPKLFRYQEEDLASWSEALGGMADLSTLNDQTVVLSHLEDRRDSIPLRQFLCLLVGLHTPSYIMNRGGRARAWALYRQGLETHPQAFIDLVEDLVMCYEDSLPTAQDWDDALGNGQGLDLPGALLMPLLQSKDTLRRTSRYQFTQTRKVILGVCQKVEKAQQNAILEGP